MSGERIMRSRTINEEDPQLLLGFPMFLEGGYDDLHQVTPWLAQRQELRCKKCDMHLWQGFWGGDLYQSHEDLAQPGLCIFCTIDWTNVERAWADLERDDEPDDADWWRGA